jgi:hypothetical protein
MTDMTPEKAKELVDNWTGGGLMDFFKWAKAQGFLEGHAYRKAQEPFALADAREINDKLGSEIGIQRSVIDELGKRNAELQLDNGRLKDALAAERERAGKLVEALENISKGKCDCWEGCGSCFNWLVTQAEDALAAHRQTKEAKPSCACGEPSPDSLVVHRTDGPCYLRPRE